MWNFAVQPLLCEHQLRSALLAQLLMMSDSVLDRMQGAHEDVIWMIGSDWSPTSSHSQVGSDPNHDIV